MACSETVSTARVKISTMESTVGEYVFSISARYEKKDPVSLFHYTVGIPLFLKTG
jgi:hypothetical protein